MASDWASVESRVDAGRVVALVLGGGRGARLYPLTAERAKPAVPLGGKYRLVDIPLSNCIHSGIKRIFVLTQFNSTSLHRHIHNSYKFDTFSNGFVEVLAAEQTAESGDWYQGTADAIRKRLRHIHAQQADYYLILAGDQLYRMDFRSLLASHVQRAADVTISVIPVAKSAAHGLGILKVRDNHRITEFVEKPTTPEQLAHLVTKDKVLKDFGVEASGREYLASMGIYVFRPEVLDELLTKNDEWQDFGRDIIPNSLRTHKVYAHVFCGFWEDIGTVRSYYEVSMRLVQPNPPFEFLDPNNVMVYTRPRHLPGSFLRDVVTTDSIICEGCRISKARIADSIIGIRTIVQPGAVVERSVVMGADYYERSPSENAIPIGIGSGSLISGAIVDKNARIGKNVVICGGPQLADATGPGYATVDGIVVVLRNAVIADGTTIGQRRRERRRHHKVT